MDLALAVYNSLTDVELKGRLEAARRNDEEACAWLYRRFSQRVFRMAAGLLGEAADAEEVTQDVFVYAFRNLGRFDPGRSSFSTWLFTIAISRCRNKRRRRRWLASIPLHLWKEPEQAGSGSLERVVEAALEARGVRRQVWAAVRSLSPKLREAVVLRYFSGLTYAEAGAVLGISPKTAESRVRLGLQAMRGLLGDMEWEFEVA